MGYQIPGADFTVSEKLPINVAATLGSSFASSLANFSKAIQAANLQAEKTGNIEKGLKKEIRFNASQKVNQTLEQAGKTYGKSSGDEENPSVYDQWSNNYVEMGRAAEDAEIQYKFGENTPEEEKELLRKVNNFDSYTKSSMENMGRLIADAKTLSDDKYKTRGNSRNGDQYRNNIILEAIAANTSGKNAVDVFGKDAKVNKVFTETGMNDDLKTTVTIPANSTFITNQINAEPELANILKKAVEREGSGITMVDGNYVFKQNTNISAYGTDGGADYRSLIHTPLVATKTMATIGAITDGTLNEKFFAKNNRGSRDFVEGEENTSVPEQENNNENKENDSFINSFVTSTPIKGSDKLEQNKIDVFDMHKIAVDKGFGIEINTETSGILRSKLPSDFENALGSYGIDDLDQFEALKYDKEKNPEGFKDLSHFFLKGTPKQLRTFTNGVVSQYIFNNTFKALENPSSGVSYTQREATGDFLTYLNDNNILNTVGEQYKEGEPVYIRQKISEVPKPSEPGVGNLYDKVFKQYTDNPTAENEKAIFSTPIKISGGKKDTFHLWLSDANPPGTYVVDGDGIKIGTQDKPLKSGAITSALGRGKSKK